MKITNRIVTAAAFTLFAGSASAAITGTAHDLTDATAGFSTTGTTQICVFCHTPHGANAAPPAPLWNKGDTGSAYTAYTALSTGSSTLDADGAIAGVSVACLSCHDGTQALDNMFNEPGSGGFNAGGATAGYIFANSPTSGVIGAGNTIPGTAATFLDIDLSNDHPVGMAYAGNAVIGTAKAANDTGAGSDPGFFAKSATDGVGALDVIPLFGSAAGDPATVECASCHDVHGTGNNMFLRVTDAGSAICLTCHDK